jgi:hypothetical protein
MAGKKEGYQVQLRDLLLTNEAAHGVAGLRANSKPMFDAFDVKLDLRRLFERIISSYRFDHAPITRAGPLNHYHTVKRSLLFADPGKTNCEH